jgi:hypothetical protein
LKDSIMRAKRFEKLLERKRKKVDKAQQKIEQADQASQTLYTNPDGSIDWNRLAKHVREATSGR